MKLHAYYRKNMVHAVGYYSNCMFLVWLEDFEIILPFVFSNLYDAISKGASKSDHRPNHVDPYT